ncbi:MAG: peroxiredoxin family protein, partial [Planctomycetota bacterium]
QGHVQAIAAAGATLLAMSVDSAADVENLTEMLGLTYPVLSDEDLRVTDAYGVREEGKDHPRPAVYVLDADRRVQWSHVGDGPADRPAAEDILDALPD